VRDVSASGKERCYTFIIINVDARGVSVVRIK